MQLEAIYHRPKLNWAYPYDQETLHIRIRAKRGDVRSAELLHGDKCLPWTSMETVPMYLLVSDERFDYWEAEVKPLYGRTCYAFKLCSNDMEVWVTEEETGGPPPEKHLGLFEFPYLNTADVFHVPDWVKDAVFYQIFPERFCNGDPSNDPSGTEEWGGEPTYRNFFGGDLDGIRMKLDHLSGLGVNAVYLTPIFEAPSNHKYDTADYRRVDPHFGTGEALKRLVDACHERGIRVVLDAVFNHCGDTFAPFRDVVEKGEASPYRDWFMVEDWPAIVREGKPNYRTFAFEPTMPKLNTAHPEVRDYLLETAEYWIREYGIDGWRLDVANEVDHAFWRAFRERVKRANPQAYILGEVWHDAVMWLQGDQFDGVMNYPYSRAVLDFLVFGHLDARQFADRIGRLLAGYPKQAAEASLNLLGSHDTVRLMTLCGGERSRMARALAVLFTSVGVPCIYYGDEVGMDGEFDPLNRRCMVWSPEDQDLELLDTCRSLIQLRSSYSCLRTGSLKVLHAEPGGKLLIYERRLDREAAVVAVHAGGGNGSASFRLPAGDWALAAGSLGTDPSSGNGMGKLKHGEWGIWVLQEGTFHVEQ